MTILGTCASEETDANRRDVEHGQGPASAKPLVLAACLRSAHAVKLPGPGATRDARAAEDALKHAAAVRGDPMQL